MVADHNWDLPPEGYKMLSAFIAPRRKSGIPADVTMKFLHVTRREFPLTYGEACELFEWDILVGLGAQEYSLEPAAEVQP